MNFFIIVYYLYWKKYWEKAGWKVFVIFFYIIYELCMHIGIIMDGNRRYAKKMGKTSFFWHKLWFENAKNIIKLAWEKGIPYITLWVLSKENLEKRSKEEIQGILSLIETFEYMKEDLMKYSIRFSTIGDISLLPQKTQDILKSICEQTMKNTRLYLTIALVYSGQDEIIRAIHKAYQTLKDLSTITIQQFRTFLDTAFLPPVDLIIRTWGNTRHSWFLLFDSAYTEYYFSDKYWPEFTAEDFEKAIDCFQKATRNFWK